MSELDDHKTQLRRLKRELRKTEERVNELRYLIREEQRIILALRAPMEREA